MLATIVILIAGVVSGMPPRMPGQDNGLLIRCYTTSQQLSGVQATSYWVVSVHNSLDEDLTVLYTPEAPALVFSDERVAAGWPRLRETPPMVAREPDASTARLTLYFEMLPPENAAFRDGGPRRGEYVTVPRNSTAFFAYEIPPRNASRWDFNAYARLTFGELAVESNRIPVTVGTDDVE